MNFINWIFRIKSQSTDDKTIGVAQSGVPTSVMEARYQEVLSQIDNYLNPTVAGNNFIELFKTVPEVFWPIDYVARRISEAHYDLKRSKDNSLVYCDRAGVGKFLTQPNPLMSWQELIYQYVVYKLCTGNTFFRAAMSEGFSEDALKCKYCDNYWVLPSNLVEIVPNDRTTTVPLFGTADIDEIIKGYRLNTGTYKTSLIPTHQILHDRDGLPNFEEAGAFLKSNSRLRAMKKPIASLIAVYEARNVIYTKRGALGFIVSQKRDESGTVALDPDEKKEIRKEINQTYGLRQNQSPYGITDQPVSFIRTNLSIQELQPFEETLMDAIAIAGAFNIPAVLVPRKDQSTFSNQDAAEQSVYYATIIPAARSICQKLTKFLGLDAKGFYIDCNFDDVACLQTGRKEKEVCDTLAFDRGVKSFNAGLCTLDDIRAIMHKEALADRIPLFGKLKFEMTPEELETVKQIFNNIQPSKGESNERNNIEDRNNEEPSV